MSSSPHVYLKAIPVWKRELDKTMNRLFFSEGSSESETPPAECPGISFLTPSPNVIILSGFPFDKPEFPGAIGRLMVNAVATQIKNIEDSGPQWNGSLCRVRGITLIGFTDDVPGPASQPNYNVQLGKKRSDYIRTQLRKAIKTKKPGLENLICIRTWSGGPIARSPGSKTPDQIKLERSEHRKVEIILHLLCSKPA